MWRVLKPLAVAMLSFGVNAAQSVAQSPEGCLTVKPQSNWVCVNGGWVPPDHPLAIAAARNQPGSPEASAESPAVSGQPPSASGQPQAAIGQAPPASGLPWMNTASHLSNAPTC